MITIAQKHSEDLAKAMAEMEKAAKANGFKNHEDWAAASAKVNAAYGALASLQGMEEASASMAENPMAAAMMGQMKASIQEVIRRAEITEADLKLVHKYQDAYEKACRVSDE